jgi:outer membrane protein assembly factor BamB
VRTLSIGRRDRYERYYKRVLLLSTTIYSVVSSFLLASILADAQPAPAGEAPQANRIVALDPRWTVSLTTPAAAPPGFDQQMAYVPLKDGGMLAIDLNVGRIAWTVDLPTSFTPATGDGMVFVGGESDIVALHQASGQTLWRTSIDAPLTGSLHWESGWLFLSTATGEVIALRSEDGRVHWRTALGSPFATVPSAAHDRLYGALADGRLVALDLDTGETQWAMSLKEEVTGVLALDEQLLVGTRANRLHSVSLDRGRLRWSQRAGADVIGAPVADESNIYFVAFDNVLRALNRGNGNLRWSRNLPSRPSGGALRGDDVVFVPFATNSIGAYLAISGEPSFTIQTVDEIGAAPFLRDTVRPTQPRLIAIGRRGALQGYASRIEPPPAPLQELPGVRVGS